jgi:hypothetical protein
MADSVLNIVLTAETEKAQKAIENFAKKFEVEIKDAVSVYDAFEKKIKEVETALKNSKSPEEVAKLTTKLREAKSAFNEIKTGQFSTQVATAAKSSNQASFAVLNLGRIAQDSAFGFIGIANNIEPFIQSIKSLKSSTEVGTSATKAFFGALAGPAGIGVLIGAVSLFDAYSNGYGIFANKAKEAKKAQEDFNSELDKAKAPALSAGLQLQAFVDIAANAKLPIEQRNKALENGNKILGDYGEKLTLANVGSKAITDQTNLFTQALIKQAVATKYADEAANVFIKQENAIKKIAEAQKKLDKVNKETAISTSQNALTEEGELVKSQVALVQKQNAIKAVTLANNEYIQITKQRKDIDNSANEALTKSTALFAELGTGTKEVAANTNNAADAQEKLNKSYEALPANSADKLAVLASGYLNLVTAISQVRAEEEARLLISEKQALLDKAKLLSTGISSAPTAEKLAKDFKPVNLFPAKDSEDLNNITAINDKVAEIKNNFALLGPIIDASFNALAGGENAVDGLKAAIKSLIIQLLKAAALAAIIAVATGGGANPISFLDAFKGALGFRAQGGTVNSKDPYIVGENGPELFIPTASGNIVSNGRFANAGGGGGGILSARVSGGDLLFILNQAGNNRSVNFG